MSLLLVTLLDRDGPRALGLPPIRSIPLPGNLMFRNELEHKDAGGNVLRAALSFSCVCVVAYCLPKHLLRRGGMLSWSDR